MDYHEDRLGRRQLLGMLAAAAGLAFSPSALAECFDLTKLKDLPLRKSLNFKPVSADPKKKCAICAFFTATPGDCGKCAIFNNGPVAAASVCDSFAPKG